jgi:hypothetical protein
MGGAHGEIGSRQMMGPIDEGEEDERVRKNVHYSFKFPKILMLIHFL